MELPTIKSGKSEKNPIKIDIKCFNLIDIPRSLLRLGASFPENELEEKRQYLKEKVQKIAEICKLTIDWSKAEWSVYYAD